MPTFNHGLFIGRAIKTVLYQTETNFELIIINNFSTDNTLEIINSFQDTRIKVFQFNNKGIIARSRNEGIRRSSAKYIAFLDSDDEWHPKKLEVCSKYIKEGHNFLCHPMNKIDELGKTIYFNNKSISKFSFYKIFLNGNYISTSSVVVCKSVLEKVGLFSEDRGIITSEDFHLWLKILDFGLEGLMLQNALGSNRQHETNSTKDIEKNLNAALIVLEQFLSNLKLSNKNKYKIEKKSKSILYCNYSLACIKVGKNKFARQLSKNAISINPFNLKFYIVYLMSILKFKNKNLFIFF